MPLKFIFLRCQLKLTQVLLLIGNRTSYRHIYSCKSKIVKVILHKTTLIALTYLMTNIQYSYRDSKIVTPTSDSDCFFALARVFPFFLAALVVRGPFLWTALVVCCLNCKYKRHDISGLFWC